MLMSRAGDASQSEFRGGSVDRKIESGQEKWGRGCTRRVRLNIQEIFHCGL